MGPGVVVPRHTKVSYAAGLEALPRLAGRVTRALGSGQACPSDVLPIRRWAGPKPGTTPLVAWRRSVVDLLPGGLEGIDDVLVAVLVGVLAVEEVALAELTVGVRGNGLHRT